MSDYQEYGFFNNMIWGTGILTLLSSVFVASNSSLSSKILETFIIGPGRTRFYKNKRSVVIRTECGDTSFPTVKLPNLDWEVYIIDSSIEDGVHNLGKVQQKNFVRCLKTCRDRLICEYLYPEDIEPVNLKLCIVSTFDDECYVASLNKGEPINYKRHVEKFTEILEN